MYGPFAGDSAVALMRRALLRAFLSGGIDGIEHRAASLVATMCGERVSQADDASLGRMFLSAMPHHVGDGVIELCRDESLGGLLADDERLTFSMLSYVTGMGLNVASLPCPREDADCGLFGVRLAAVDALWEGHGLRYPSEVGLSALCRYGTVMPDFMAFTRSRDGFACDSVYGEAGM